MKVITVTIEKDARKNNARKNIEFCIREAIIDNWDFKVPNLLSTSKSIFKNIFSSNDLWAVKAYLEEIENE